MNILCSRCGISVNECTCTQQELLDWVATIEKDSKLPEIPIEKLVKSQEELNVMRIKTLEDAIDDVLRCHENDCGLNAAIKRLSLARHIIICPYFPITISPVKFND